MKIRCLIVDDKPLAIDILTEYVKKVSFLELAGTTTNPIEALSILRQQPVDLIFLDIQMPELTGLQFMKITGGQCKFILTTAYAEYALDGYEHNVVDYLLKPIPFERFYRAAEKALHILKPQLQSPGKLANEAPHPEYLFVKTEHRIQKVDLKDILYAEGMQNYIILHTAGERVMSLLTLKKLEEQLPSPTFVRVHKSYIVSVPQITAIERSRIYIGKTIIPIGDSYREEFYKLIEKQ